MFIQKFTAVAILLTLAACTAPDGSPLITKPGCGLIACNSGVSDYYRDKIDQRRNAETANTSSYRTPVIYRRSGNVQYGSDGTICRQSEGGNIYCQ
jgi:hypothetical protein